MRKFFIAALVCAGSLSASAGNFGSGGSGGDCGQDQDDDQQEEVSHVWTCYADNLIQKGFLGQSTSKSSAMRKAMAQCEIASQLPCFESVCRHN